MIRNMMLLQRKKTLRVEVVWCGVCYLLLEQCQIVVAMGVLWAFKAIEWTPCILGETSPGNADLNASLQSVVHLNWYRFCCYQLRSGRSSYLRRSIFPNESDTLVMQNQYLTSHKWNSNARKNWSKVMSLRVKVDAYNTVLQESN